MKYRILILAPVLLVALAGSIGWLAGTTGGLRFVAARALPHLPVTLEPSEIEGRLVGPLSLGRIRFDVPGLGGEIESVELDWRLGALLGRTLHVRELRITRPRLVLEPAATPPDESARDDEAAFSLPFKLILEKVSVIDGELRSADAVIVEGLDLELAGRASGEQFELERLELRSSRGAIDGHVRASLDPAAPWDVDLSWQFAMDDAPVAGHTRIEGRLALLEIVQEVSAPLTARIDGTVSGLPEAPAWQLGVVIEALPPRAGPWPEVLDGFAAELQLEGDVADSLLAGHFRLPAHLPGRVAVDGRAGWVDGEVALRRLELALEDGARLAASGRFVPGDAPEAEFEVQGTDLGWPLGDTAREIELPSLTLQGSGAGDRWRVTLNALARRDGLPETDVNAVLHWTGTLLTVEQLALNSTAGEINATARGTLDTADEQLDYRLTAEADVQLPDYPPLSAVLTVVGDAQGLLVETLAAELLGGTVTGGGRIAWTGDEAADFRLEFADLDPASLAPDWPGRLAGALDLKGLPTTQGGLEITLRALRGELKSLPLEGEAALNIGVGEYLLRRASLTLGGAELEASGRLDDEEVMLEASLEIPALQDLDAAARGAFSATAHVTGAPRAPQIEFGARGDRLRWQANRARVLRVDAMVDVSGGRPSQLLAELEGFATAPGPGASLRLQGDGVPEDHRVRLELLRARPEQQFSLALAGGLVDERWSGVLSELSITAEQQEIWTLQAPASLSADTEAVTLSEACMDGTLGLLCLEGGWTRAGPSRGRATLAQLDLGPLSEWLGMGLAAQGVVTGHVYVEADDEVFRTLSGGLVLTAGDIRLTGEDSNPLVAWEGGALELTGNEDEARAVLNVVLAAGDRVEGELKVGWNAADPPLEGGLESELSQLEIITELLPDLSDLEGRATMQASISGTLSAPRLTGRFEWLDGTAEIPMLGLRPKNINVVAALVEGIMSFTATGRSGDGEFEADGRFDLGADTVDGRATLRGENLLLANLPEARVTASPDLRLHYSGRDVTIGGEVDIPFARISGLGTPGAVTVSPDEVIVGPRSRVEEDGLAVSSRVRVTVGPDVQVQATGLRGKIEGSILTVTEPRALPWGRGEIRVVDGTFGVFGQTLEIETGRLIYTGGSLENPGLEIRAVRKVDNVTAGALVRGTLQQPEISVYSDPAMPSAEALSYLTLGKSLDQLQAGEQTTINQAASSLALSGGGMIARDLGRRLGLDDISVTADDASGGASVVISKYLGSGLYVSYGLGLFDTVNTLRLRYQINQRLSLEATSGDEAAADLFYTFERD